MLHLVELLIHLIPLLTQLTWSFILHDTFTPLLTSQNHHESFESPWEFRILHTLEICNVTFENFKPKRNQGTLTVSLLRPYIVTVHSN